MTAESRDPDLGALYRALRERDRRAGRSFRAILEAAPRASRRRTPRFAAAIAIALLAAITLLARPRATSSPPGAPDLTTEIWRSPTGFLLRTPGSELISGVPRLSGRIIELPAPIEHPRPRPTADTNRRTES
jgi:hypothetical protein